MTDHCIMANCKNVQRTRGVCSTHREQLYEYGSLEVQRAVEAHEHEQLLKQAEAYDWHYLTEDQTKAIELGVRDAYFENGDLQDYDHENMLQEAWIWAASHKAEVERIEAFTTLRKKAKDRAIKANKTEWNTNRELVSLEAMFEDAEED